jgi:hypothetical protein
MYQSGRPSKGLVGNTRLGCSRRRVSRLAMTMPVVVRPRPIWQLNTSAAPAGGSQQRCTGKRQGEVPGSRRCTSVLIMQVVTECLITIKLTVVEKAACLTGGLHLPTSMSSWKSEGLGAFSSVTGTRK